MSKAAVTRRALLFSGAAAPFLRARPAPPRPNILWILGDNLAAWQLGCYGNQEIRTPNIDLLARTGTRMLTNVICTPASSPSRATLFTGRAPSQFSATAPLISDVLAGAGYQCGFCGKWDMGDGEKPQHGFREWFTVPPASGYRNEQGYVPDLITARAIQLLEAAKPGNPFFLVVSHLNPRPPYEGLPPKNYDLYENVPFTTTGWQPAAPNAAEGKEYLKNIRASLRQAAAAITALDDQLAPLLAKLEQRQLRDSTVIVFTSATGSLLGRHGLWGEGNASDPPNMYDDVMVTPMIWSWRGKVPPLATRPELVSVYDVVPTLCEALGLEFPGPQQLCGRSYWPALLNRPFPKKKPWHNEVFGESGTMRMARDHRFKLILRNDGNGPNEFYSLAADPGEKANQYDNPSFVSMRDQLAADLAAWRKKQAA